MAHAGKKSLRHDSALELMSREDLIGVIRSMVDGGVSINFHGKRLVHEVYKKVRPRQTIIKKELSVGKPEEQVRNLLIEGENLQAMVTLYKERGQVDLILTDPPYNTGQTFRYNDKWDEDPNDPDLGQIVKLDDGSRHTKWMKAMLPRLHMMHAMLKPSGVIAVCIDDNELFHLGMMLDEIFGEENRLGILNWQKAYSPKNDAKTVSKTTEYVLVYAKDRGLSKTGRVDFDRSNVGNIDNDKNGPWIPSDPTARQHRKDTAYAIQSPVTGYLHYPNGEYRYDGRLPEPRSHWVNFTKPEAHALLEEWGSAYVEKDLGDERGKALVLKGSKVSLTNYDPSKDRVVKSAAKKAAQRRDAGNWPNLYFRDSKDRQPGHGRPRLKNYVESIKEGKVPTTFWDEDQYLSPLELGSITWPHQVSGHTDLAKRELDQIVGRDHSFDTVKPLRLMKKIIQIWCPEGGLVMDPYAGSGTTGHAVLELNAETEARRRFILIEQGSPEKGDKYARSLTQVRLRRAITGERPTTDGNLKHLASPLPGGFQFRQLTQKIDSRAVLNMKKDELIDLVITSHWENARRNNAGLIRLDNESFKYLVGRSEQNEGYFLIWNGGDKVGQLDESSYATVVAEAKRAGLKQPYHVYARYEIYQSRNVLFYKIPDKILAHLGLNESSDSFNEEGGV